MQRIHLIFLLIIITILNNCSRVSEEGNSNSRTINIDYYNLLFEKQTINTVSYIQINISNSGNSDLNIQSIDCPLGFSSDFSSGIIESGMSKPVKIYFSPSIDKIYSGNITIKSNATSRNNSISVSGEGVSNAIPNMLVSENPLLFGGIAKSQWLNKTLIIYNTGAAPLLINNIYSTNSVFTPNYLGNIITIAPNDKYYLSIMFSPSAYIQYNETLTFSTNIGVKTVNMNGRGIPFSTPLMGIYSNCEGAYDDTYPNQNSHGLITAKIYNIDYANHQITFQVTPGSGLGFKSVGKYYIMSDYYSNPNTTINYGSTTFKTGDKDVFITIKDYNMTGVKTYYAITYQDSHPGYPTGYSVSPLMTIQY